MATCDVGYLLAVSPSYSIFSWKNKKKCHFFLGGGGLKRSYPAGLYVKFYPAEPAYIIFGKQCRSRSAGFLRNQLIWICTVFHDTYDSIVINWIILWSWLEIQNMRGILINSAGQRFKWHLLTGYIFKQGWTIFIKGAQFKYKYDLVNLTIQVTFESEI